MEKAGPLHHVFVDFENVHEIDPSVVADRSISFTLLLGARQKQVRVELVEQLLLRAASVHLIRLTSSGQNALDFALAYYLGRAACAEPGGCFHIISRDKGFDPLIEHLLGKNIQAQRHDDFSTVPVAGSTRAMVKTAAASSVRPAKSPPTHPNRGTSRTLSDRARQFSEHLESHPDNRPKKRATLLRHIVSQFGHKLTDVEADGIIEELRREGRIATSDKGGVSYLSG